MKDTDLVSCLNMEMGFTRAEMGGGGWRSLVLSGW